ncbi:MAG: hypothetical protein A2158_07315 [Chloroflexi bacterium RBG_13_46_14]|nr:MAG: hypothetical protein A2158_07315 [Chloroflexi bacterium RBG_13_46_14]
MADNESLSNKQEDIAQEELKLSPWLQKRLEERADPFTSLGLFAGLSTFAVRNRRFQRLWEGSGRLGRAGLVPAISRTGRLPLVSKALLGIISRTATIGASSLYKMLDLPWFRPGRRSHREEAAENTEFVVRQEMNDVMNTTAPDYRIQQPLPGLVDEQELMRAKNIPEAYFDRIFSPPITRKTPRSIWEHTPSPVVVKATPVGTDHIAEAFPPSDAASRQYPAPGISKSISQQVVDQEAVLESYINEQARIDETTGRPSTVKEDKHEERSIVSRNNTRESDIPETDGTGKDTSHTYPVKELFYVKPLRVARKIVQSLPFVRKNQNNESGATSHPVSVASHPSAKQNRQKDYDKPLSLENISVAREKPVVTPETAGLSIVSDENNIGTRDVSIEDSKEILHESRRVQSENRENSTFTGGGGIDEGTGYTYRAVDLFDDKLPQVARRIEQSLPSVGNIPRKVVLPPEPVQRRVDRPLSQQPVHRRIDRTLPRQPVRHRIDETLPEKPIEYRGDKDPPQQSVQRRVDKDLPRQPVQRRGDGDLPRQSVQRRVDEKPPQEPTQHPVDETSPQEPVKYHADETQIEMKSKYRPEKNNEPKPLYMRGSGSYRPLHKLPLTPQVKTAMGTGIARKAILDGDISTAMPDFAGSANHTLDLPLAPVTRIEVMRQQEENLRTGQIQGEPETLRLTQNTQSTQTPPTGTSRTAEADSSEGSTENSKEKTADYRTIAREIYPFIRRMIMIERERMLPR